jgi:hypothetical protein
VTLHDALTLIWLRTLAGKHVIQITMQTTKQKQQNALESALLNTSQSFQYLSFPKNEFDYFTGLLNQRNMED